MYAPLVKWHNVDVTNLEVPEIVRSVLRVTHLSEALVSQVDSHAGSHTTEYTLSFVDCKSEDTS